MDQAGLSSYLHGEQGVIPVGMKDENYLSKLLFNKTLTKEEIQGLDHANLCQRLSSYGPRQDETCVLCNDCFQHSCHEGHDVYFYHSAAGGCCDCGDAAAWSPEGFCCHHGKRNTDPVQFIPATLCGQAKTIFSTIADDFEHFCGEYCRLLFENEITSEDGEQLSLYLYADDVHSYEELFHVINGRLNYHLSSQEVSQALMQRGYVQMTSYYNQTLEILQTRNFKFRLLTKQQERARSAVVQALKWMRSIALICDGVCYLACQVLDSERLRRIFVSDMYLDKELGVVFHDLLLTLMAEQSFKMTAAIAYAAVIRKVSADYRSGFGISGSSLFNLSVQFLNRDYFVHEICFHYSFLDNLIGAVYDMVHVPVIGESDFSTVFSIFKRRYSPVIGDCKIIFTIPEISRLFLTTCSSTFFRLLCEAQLLHSQKRAFESHVIFEDSRWMSAFNLTLGMASLFDHVTNWFGDPTSVSKLLKICSSLTKIHAANVQLVDVGQVMVNVVRECFQWQQSKENGYADTASSILSEAINFESLDLLGKESHIILRYFSMSFVRTDAKSFHLPLHRFLGHCVMEASKHPHLCSTLYNIGLLLAEDSKHTTSMLFTMLQPILFGNEIREGKWKRNGNCVLSQLFNYSEAPCCKYFRDLDLMVVQTTMIVLPASVFLLYLFNESGIIKLMLQDDLVFVGTSVPLEPDFSARMIAECLSLIIMVLTELPREPQADPSVRLISQIRREWIHRLAAESCSFSQLQESISICAGYDKLPSQILDSLLLEIAVKNQISALTAPTYSLRKELWGEYDPCFPHLNDASHQSALEKKPKLNVAHPIVQPLATPHECFSEIRPKILFDPIFLISLRNILHSAAWKRLGLVEYDRQRLLDVAFDCNDTVLNRALHVLTLAMHEATSMITERRDESVVGDFFKLLVEEKVVHVGHETADSFRLHPSIFGTLFRLKGWHEENHDFNTMYHIEWILNKLVQLSPECKEIMDILSPPKPSAAVESSPVTDFEQLKKINKEKALLSIQAAASQFLASLEDISDSEEGEEEEEAEEEGIVSNGDIVLDTKQMDEEGTNLGDDKEREASVKTLNMTLSTKANSGDTEDDLSIGDDLLCIICQTELGVLEADGDGEQQPGDFVGCLALLQCTTIGRETSRDIFIADPLPSENTSILHKGVWNSCNYRIGLCGHMMHSYCFETYKASMLLGSARDNHLIVDAAQGYVTCPLCKKLCNTLIPMKIPNNMSDKKDKEKKSKAFIEGFSAVEWFKSLALCVQDHSLESSGGLELKSAPQVDDHVLERKDTVYDLSAAIEFLLNMIAYTLSMDITEHIAPAYHLQYVQQLMIAEKPNVSFLSYGKYSPGFDDLKNVSIVLEAIGQVCCLEKTIVGGLIRQLLNVIFPSKNPNHSRSMTMDDDSWLGSRWPPLLQLPLLDIMMLIAGLSTQSLDIVMHEADDSIVKIPGLQDTSALISSVSWLCLAKLIQLCIEYSSEDTVQNRVDDSTSPPLDTSINCLYHFVKTRGNFENIGSRKFLSILKDWLLFIRIVIHTYTRMPFNPIRAVFIRSLDGDDASWAVLPLSEGVITASLVRPHLFCVGLSFLLDDGSPLDAQEVVSEAVGNWLQDKSSFISMAASVGSPMFDYRKCGRFQSYPCLTQRNLIALPKDYAQLHSKVLSLCTNDMPAICLVCGAIVDAGGHGQCFAHSLFCGEGVGIFFLFQDCNIVLCHGPRSSYFPSVYLDSYGEIHKSFRSKPLRLDPTRLEVLRSLWANYGIASEVTIKRSSATRLIINGYF
eukprot:scaffold369_cov177-Ochromonas_danica.AAC.50